MVNEMDASPTTDQRPPLVVGIGELIWDLLPEGKRLGGAPSNFAYVSRLLGNEAAVASRVGRDELGREAAARLARTGVAADYLQADAEHPTGTVGVEIGEGGEPRFSVNENSAWDYLEMTAEWERLAARADVVCFGTLGRRRPEAGETIRRFLSLTRPDALRVFDVNLRHSFFTTEMLSESLRAADVVKFNSEELSAAASMLGLARRGARELCETLISAFGLRVAAVTSGESGSLLVARGAAVAHPGYRVRVADTIGCGDAFTATLAHCLLRGVSLEAAGAMANRMGAWIATQAGATPEADPRTVERVLKGSGVTARGRVYRNGPP
jgi:fructokinase